MLRHAKASNSYLKSQIINNNFPLSYYTYILNFNLNTDRDMKGKNFLQQMKNSFQALVAGKTEDEELPPGEE